MRSTNYAFATGKIRFLETKLLDANDIERMIDAPSLDSSFRVLYDTDYADNLSGLSVEDFEKAILEDLGQLKDLLVKIIPDKDFLKLLLLEYDFFNLKVIFKGKLFQKELNHLLIKLGFFEPADLKKIVLGENKTDEYQEIKEIIKEADCFFSQQTEPYKIEFFFDKKYFILLQNLAKKTKNRFIINFINFKINLVNLRIFLRLKNSSLASPDFLKEALLEGGNITTKEFINLASKELNIVINTLSKKFPDRFSKYFSDFLERQKFWLLEKKLFEEEIDYLKKAKAIAYGPEVVMAYFYAKRNVNKNVRLIMSGKLNKIDNLILRERVRKLY